MPISDSNFKDRILAAYADAHCKKIARQVIRELKAMAAGDPFFGDDSGLESFWEELCVQVQHREPFRLSGHEGVTDFHIHRKVEDLWDHEKMAVWWQTDHPYELYDGEEEDIEGFEYDLPVIVAHIRDRYILPAAASFRNRRIRAWLAANLFL